MKYIEDSGTWSETALPPDKTAMPFKTVFKWELNDKKCVAFQSASGGKGVLPKRIYQLLGNI